MINSGLSLLRALTILSEQTEQPALGEVIIEVRPDVEKGTSLSAALARAPQGLQPPLRGHGPGRRDRWFLDHGAGPGSPTTFEKEVELRGKIRSA